MALRDLAAHHRIASDLLASVRDVVAERSVGASAPAWCERRAWAPLLERLCDDDVARAERDGLAACIPDIAAAPRDLMDLARAVSSVTDFPVPVPVPVPVPDRKASQRKRTQVAAFGAIVATLGVKPARIVDIGSGHGHLTRHLARALGVPAEGWEIDAARVGEARRLSEAGGPRFVAADVTASALDLGANDLVVGLHACGELGDRAVRLAAEARAPLALIGCCLQKRPGDRVPLCDYRAAELTLGRAVLGLGNARDGDDGVEADLATRHEARVRRIALRHAFHAAGVPVAPGEEMRGINRRRAVGPLSDLVARAFASRGLAVPAARAIDEAERAARAEYALTRRYELPRAMLARLVEVWVALDRAAFLAAHGHTADVALAFARDTSPRNVVIRAHCS
jgi:SAM-dependent methyltransferase